MKAEQSYPRLDPRLTAAVEPTPVMDPQWIAFNDELAEQLAIPAAQRASDDGLQIFSGNQVPDWAQPHALAYAGHQFANYVPQLGDGRAVLLTEVIGNDGRRYDIQLKGSGRTPYSRGGDGRSPIGPVLREYLLSEAMHRLGVPTTRALAAVATGELVQREEALPGAILTRVAASHLRVGTAQYVLAFKERDLLKKFADYVIDRHYPHCANAEDPYLALLEAVIDRQAQLIAQWMSLGFIHGVMNTDNMTLSGETIDYGPCAFMEAYDPATVFSFIDRRGRYAYQNQPGIGVWNLARFAETLLPLIKVGADDTDDAKGAIKQATAAIEQFQQIYEGYYWQRMTAKIGLPGADADAKVLTQDYLELMQQQQVDFTLAFRLLGDSDPKRLADLFENSQAWQDWHQRWQQAITAEDASMSSAQTKLNRINPAYIPRNHLVEAAIEEAVQEGSLALFNQLNEVLRTPFVEQDNAGDFFQPATPEQAVPRTFCGT
ncbi:YdiU family protein [Pseudidiomarina sp. 1APP75-27a]|uniref:protein adenylyltransferase SelO n=1 Tax=Pseudidiomarina terrestris TaxID=2820060 RepID=UPI002B0571A9|nr:YdiU family protein [Pseudidiomarina sp. 1APP75-27a]MEA3586876.1 YdiU family protein [Pseudidiomarina sp. 1APP75-27a]